MQASPEGHISITVVSKYFGRHKALDNVSLEIPPGSVTVILGPSGSGKSTLLRTINHLERVDEGFIQIWPLRLFLRFFCFLSCLWE